jgi:hypothetical protein
MKNFLLVLIFIVFALNAFPQGKKNQLNFSIGPSFAIGDFGDKSNPNSNEDAGLAGGGADLYLYYGHKFTRNIGLGVKWFGNSNKYDTDPAIEELNNSTGTLWTTPTAFWSVGGFLIGLTIHAPASEKFIIDFRFLGGYVVSSSPECKYSVKDQPDIWVKMESASAAADGYDVGTGFTYLFNPKWSLNINLDYMIAYFTYDKVYIIGSDGTSQHVHDAKQPVEIINTTIGISFNF